MFVSGSSAKDAGARLRLTRRAKGWGQAYVAQLLGVSSQSVWNWETAFDGRYMPHDELLRFCSLAGVDPAWILQGERRLLLPDLAEEIARIERGGDPPQPSRKKRRSATSK